MSTLTQPSSKNYTDEAYKKFLKNGWRETQIYLNMPNSSLNATAAELRNAEPELRGIITACIIECAQSLAKRGAIESDKNQYNRNLIAYLYPPISAEELLFRICEHLDSCTIFSEKELHIVEIIVDILEEQLYNGIQYLSWEGLKRILPQLRDRTLAYKCLERHLKTIDRAPTKKDCQDEQNFIYMLIGIATRFGNDGGEIAQRLSDKLPCIITGNWG